MAYLPKIKQKVGGKINGFLKDPATGLKFAGSFVRDFKGNFFKGKSITKKSKPLEFVPEGSVSTDEVFRNVQVNPTSLDYSKGSFVRYFARDTRDGKVVELDKISYLKIQKEKKLYRKTLKIEWFIKGNPEDEIINGYLYPGVKAKNIDVAKKAEKLLPGITVQQLSNYSEFVSQTDKKIQENLFTSGGEFKIKGTNEVYVGSYHIHPDKGPMVGAKHISTPHKYLEKIVNIVTEQPTEPETETEEAATTVPTTPIIQVTSTPPPAATSRGTGFTTGGGGGGGGGY